MFYCLTGAVAEAKHPHPPEAGAPSKELGGLSRNGFFIIAQSLPT